MKSYSAYKDSGIEWLGEIPEEWKVHRFKNLFVVSTEKNGENIVGEMLSVSGYRGIEIKKYDHDEQKRLQEDLVEYRVVRIGQLVVNTMWLNYAGLGVSNYEGYVSPAYRAYDISPSLENRFVHHLLRSSNYVWGYTKHMQGVRPNSLQIKTEDFRTFPILIPTVEEQTTIATYLDQKTQQIDRLIEIKERQIELLKEQRSAIINQAVTKGLDPHVSMKDSGIEWIGEIPKGWNIVNFSKLGTFRNGVNKPKESYGHGTRFVTVKNLYGNGVIEQNILGRVEITDEEYESFRLQKFDILMSRSSVDPEGVGHPAIIEDPTESTVFSGFVIRFRPNHLVFPVYIYRLLSSAHYRGEVVASANTVAQTNISQPALKRIQGLVPPLQEQTTIATYLDQKTQQIDHLTESTQTQITQLQEYRTALISAVVTGKIDVRDEV